MCHTKRSLIAAAVLVSSVSASNAEPPDRDAPLERETPLDRAKPFERAAPPERAAPIERISPPDRRKPAPHALKSTAVDFDKCLAAAPAATLSVAPTARDTVFQESPAEYGAAACDAYVVDINAQGAPPMPLGPRRNLVKLSAADARIGAPIIGGSRIEEATNPDQCSEYSEAVALFKKDAVEFKPVLTYTRMGRWHQKTTYSAAYCAVEVTGTADLSPQNVVPPMAGLDSYRIVAKAELNGKARPVKVTAETAQQPGVN